MEQYNFGNMLRKEFKYGDETDKFTYKLKYDLYNTIVTTPRSTIEISTEGKNTTDLEFSCFQLFKQGIFSNHMNKRLLIHLFPVYGQNNECEKQNNFGSMLRQEIGCSNMFLSKIKVALYKEVLNGNEFYDVSNCTELMGHIAKASNQLLEEYITELMNCGLYIQFDINYRFDKFVVSIYETEHSLKSAVFPHDENIDPVERYYRRGDREDGKIYDKISDEKLDRLRKFAEIFKIEFDTKYKDEFIAIYEYNGSIFFDHDTDDKLHNRIPSNRILCLHEKVYDYY